MDNKKTKDPKKIIRALLLLLISLALIVGIVFSSLKIGSSIYYGPEYDGAFQASVQVVSKDKDAKYTIDEAADALQNKLAPFSNQPVQVSKKGKNHLNVIAGKGQFNDNENNFRSKIESDGGMYVLKRSYDPNKKTSSFEDLYTNQTVIKALGKNGRIAPSDVFSGKVNVESIQSGNGRSPYVVMDMAKGEDGSYNFQKIWTALTTDGQAQGQQTFDGQAKPQDLYYMTDLEELIDKLRTLYTIKQETEKQEDELIETVFNEVLKPINEYLKENKEDNWKKDVLYDLFASEVVWKKDNSTITSRISLLENDKFKDPLIDNKGIQVSKNKYVKAIKSADDLKAILPLFSNGPAPLTSSFLYSSDATDSDLNKVDNRVWWDWSNREIKKEANITKADMFNLINDLFLGKILVKEEGTIGVGGLPKLNENIVKFDNSIKDHFIYHGGLKEVGSETNSLNSLSGSHEAFIIEDNAGLKEKNRIAFYLATNNLTTAKYALASIKQNSLGISFNIEFVSSINPYITSALFITSIVVLSLIALLLAAYILFVYRILGLFTIIIAVTAIVVTLVSVVGLGIAFGPQILCALFVIVALVIDTNLILFEGIKRNIYKEKMGVFTSFKIGNKETLSMAIDAIIVTLIPNIILFWVGSGGIKNFATATIIGAVVVIIASLLIGRLIYWLIMKSDFITKNNWLLPINTEFSSIATFKEQYKINKIEGYLKAHEGKTNFTSKELIKIKKYNDQLRELKLELSSNQLERTQKLIQLDKKTIENTQKRIERYSRIVDKYIRIFRLKNQGSKSFFVKKMNHIIADNTYLLKLEEVDARAFKADEDLKEMHISEKDKVLKKTRVVNRGSLILAGIVILIAIIAAIVGSTVGPNYSTTYGIGQTFVVYGDNLNKIHDAYFENDNLKNDKVEKIVNDIKDKYADSIEEIKNQNANQSEYQKHINYIYAEEVMDLLEEVNSKDLYKDFFANAPKINLKNATFEVNQNYKYDKSDNTDVEEQTAVIVNTTSTDGLERTNFKRFLIAMQKGHWPSKPDWDEVNDSNNSQGGIFAYDMQPYTNGEQLKEIAIVFGILLAALIVYIVIRFKWTYYVALALGIVLTMGITISLMIVFRIPISVELLSGIVFLITFSLTTMILVLGRGKSQLRSQDKEKIANNFVTEIKMAASIRAQKAKYKEILARFKNPINKLKKDIKVIKKDIKHGLGDVSQIEIKQEQINELKAELKAQKKINKEIYIKFKKEKNEEINIIQRRNWYFKKVFADLINYSLWRMILLGTFYIATAIVLAATLPSLYGMGLIIMIGMIVGFAVSLFAVVPTWIYFERQRIKNVYGRKYHIKQIKVSHEEQIVKDIND